jgi:Phosphate-selective porin O and P
MRKQIFMGAIAASCAISTVASAVDVGDNTTVGGQFFLDFGNITQQQNGTDVPPSGSGFDVKRAYLIVNHTFDEVWSANLTADANYVNSAAGTGLSNSTTANSGGVTEFFIKYLYGQAKFSDAFTIRAGSEASPWIPFVDSVTGLRWIEKGTTDRLGFGNSADWGLNALGKLGDGLVNYSASIVDGGGYKNPTRTKNVDFEARVDVHPISWATIAGGYYNGHLGQVTATNDGFAKNTASRWNVLADVKGFGFNVGAEYFQAKNYKTASASTGVESGPGGVVIASTATGAVVSDEAGGVSGWVTYDFTKSWEAFARYDNAQISKDVDRNLRDKFFDAGVIFRPHTGVDVALVYKYETVNDGTIGVSSADGNASYTIGGTGVANTGVVTDGKFNEIGVYSQIKF